MRLYFPKTVFRSLDKPHPIYTHNRMVRSENRLISSTIDIAAFASQGIGMSVSCALGHFGLVGSGGQRDLPGRTLRGLLYLGQNSERNFLGGDKIDDNVDLQTRHHQSRSINRAGGREPRYCRLCGPLLSVIGRKLLGRRTAAIRRLVPNCRLIHLECVIVS